MMTKIKETYNYRIPVDFISAIVNGDDSGLEDDDITSLDSFLEDIPKNGTFDWPEDIDEAKYFAPSNDVLGYIGADVIDVDYIIFETAENK